MQQVLNFLQKNSYKMLFFLLMIISLRLTIQTHSLQQSVYINSSNIVSGYVYEKTNDIKEYFVLKKTNDELVLENQKLKEQLFNKKDTTIDIKKIKTPFDVAYNVIAASVIKNSFNKQHNYLTLKGGALQGIKTDMGVINQYGIVGKIAKTSPNYSTVTSILFTDEKTNAKLKNTNHFGSIIWNGKNMGYVQLIELPRLATVRKGDTIVTGGYSTIFPENIPIGTIDKVYIDRVTNYYTVDVRLFNDMSNLGNVYVIDNKNKTEIETLEQIHTDE